MSSAPSIESTLATWRDGTVPPGVRSQTWRRRVDAAARWGYYEVERGKLLSTPRCEGYRVTVARSSGHAQIVVPASRLAGWHVAVQTAGGRYVWPRPMIAAYMLCSEIPEEQQQAFGHLCTHGQAPHLIRVAVVPWE